MTPNYHNEIIKKVQSMYLAPQPAQDYFALSSSIRKNIAEIKKTQQKFDVQMFLEKNMLLAFPYEQFKEIMKRLKKDPMYGEWSRLFSDQLGNVRSLNNDLVSLIRGSEIQLNSLSSKLSQSLAEAESHDARLDKEKRKLPGAYKEMKHSASEGKYEKLRKEIASEHLAMLTTQEIILLNSVAQTDDEKIDFLRRHAFFHRGALFSAKKLAVVTEQICNALENLTGVYETIRPIGSCLNGIHKGISTLRGYTDVLHSVYADTFSVMQKLSNDPSSFDVLSASSKKLDPVVQQMLLEMRI
jgi:hypothetical protein